MGFIAAYVLFPIASYLLGSVSFGLAVAKIKGVDLRKRGSGNTGAANVLRVLGIWPAVVVFVLDVLKGAVPALGFALIAEAISGVPSWKMLGIVYGACAIFGHVYPVFYQLRGGKAVATSCGVFLCLAPLQTLTALALWAVVLLLWKYVSVASMAAAASFFLMVIGPLYPGRPFIDYNKALDEQSYYSRLMHALYPIPEGMAGREKLLMSGLALLAAAVVLYRHRANIKRLKEGTEPRILTTKHDLRAKEAEKKYGKERLRAAGRRRNLTRSTEALRRLSRRHAEDDTQRIGEPEEVAVEHDGDAAESQQLETEAPLEEVEEIPTEAVEPMIDEENTDTEETREALPQLEEAAEEEADVEHPASNDQPPASQEGNDEEEASAQEPASGEEKPDAGDAPEEKPDIEH